MRSGAGGAAAKEPTGSSEKTRGGTLTPDVMYITIMACRKGAWGQKKNHLTWKDGMRSTGFSPGSAADAQCRISIALPDSGDER